MSETLNVKSDGSDGNKPLIVQSGQNSALKEAATWKEGDGVQKDHPLAAHVKILDRQKALVETDRKKYALCGFASSTRHQIPVNAPDWEIWGMNQLYRHIPRADRWFDVHWNWNAELVPGTDHEAWIRECGIPVYMIEAHPHLATTVKFPIAELMGIFGDYYTSTVAHMLALAIWEIDAKVAKQLKAERLATAWDGYKRARELYEEFYIGLFGIDLVVGEEYAWQKPCAEYWIGQACGRGITVYVPPQSALCKQRFRYGYETEPSTILKPAELGRHRAAMSAEKDKLMRQLYMLDGAMQADEFWNEAIELRLRGADIKL